MIRPSRIGPLISLAVFGALATPSGAAQGEDRLALQQAQYDAVRAKTVMELQPFRDSRSAVLPDGGTVMLTSLNPTIGAWFILQLFDARGRLVDSYHLENPEPQRRALSLDPDGPALVLDETGAQTRCAPWGEALDSARNSGAPYAPLCDGRILLRNRSRGSRTDIEAVTDFLRDNIWGGEQIVRFVRDNFYKDSQLETAETLSHGGDGSAVGGPPPMLTDTPEGQRPVIGTLLEIAVTGAKNGRLAIGEWYPVTGLDGVYASAFQPGAVARSVLAEGRANRLDSVESAATGYMVAFDLSKFGLGFSVGTDHPAVGWSPRPPASARPRGLPGPDGITSIAPLVPLGMVNPVDANRTVATFTGGFKREHGAFKYGDLATYNMGHHYGFIENGTILSKLQPKLSTLFVMADGTIRMKTWTEEDNALLPQIRFARQNGVPLIEEDPETGRGMPGDRVTLWGPGNWSGSAEADLRTLRAGACLVRSDAREFLVYGYFSTATPSAMARTFQAYQCHYAMLLDMNALELTYLALYVRQGGKVHVEHIVPGMGLIEKKARDGTVLPRFIAHPDNRDLFYVMRKRAGP